MEHRLQMGVRFAIKGSRQVGGGRMPRA